MIRLKRVIDLAATILSGSEFHILIARLLKKFLSCSEAIGRMTSVLRARRHLVFELDVLFSLSGRTAPRRNGRYNGEVVTGPFTGVLTP